jgi:hypothetical protein
MKRVLEACETARADRLLCKREGAAQRVSLGRLAVGAQQQRVVGEIAPAGGGELRRQR